MFARLVSSRRVRRSIPLFSLSLYALIAAPAFAQELPTGAKVVSGSAAISGTPQTLTVQQSTDKAIIDWSSFSIGQGGNVRFDNGAGATLNRVTGSTATSIDGLLSASGSVYLINKNGIVVGQHGVIDVGGRFVGSTQDLSNASFLAGGALTLAGASEAAIVNYGKIGSLGGDVVLVAANVENRGEISAAKGSVGLLAGYQVLLRDQSLDDGKFSVVVGGSGTQASNLGAIQAAEAELRAQGGNVYALAGNITGVINARGVTQTGGRIFLSAGSGETRVSGLLSAKTADGAGGEIEVTGRNVLLDDGAKLDASGAKGGTVLVGGDWQGGENSETRLRTGTVQRAAATVMADGAVIDVSGSETDGGVAVLWSDDYTNFLGAIDARGAVDGGRVETSSKANLQAFGLVDAGGTLGEGGQWLLDPASVNITAATANGAFDGGNPNIFTPTTGAATVAVGTINAGLNAGTSVTITTGGAGVAGGTGDITVSSAISKTAGGDATLTLKADRDILINAAIGSTAGKLNLVLNSRANGAATGRIVLGAAITTLGGDITGYGGATAGGNAIAGGTDVGVNLLNAVVVNAGGGNIRFNAALASGGNNSAIYLNTDAQLLTGGAGGIFLTGDGTPSAGRGISIAAVTMAAGLGGINLTGSSIGDVGIAFGGGTFTSTGDISLTGSSSTNNGIWRYNVTDTTVTASGAGNVRLTGTNAGLVNSIQGIMIEGAALHLTSGAAGGVFITGSGGVAAGAGTKSAINFGSTNFQNIAVAISGGAGGVTIAGTGLTGADQSFAAYGVNNTIVSSGDINIAGNKSIYYVSAISETGAGAINLTTGGLLNAGAITTAGAGNINLTSVGDLITGAINKTAAATGASTVTIKSDNDVTVNAGIVAASGAGAMTTVLNSRAAGGTTGIIAVTGPITTRGGNITGYGGATVGGNAIGSGADIAVALIGGTLDAGGGNIAFNAATAAGSTSNAINVWDSTKLLTSGAGSIILNGNAVLGTGAGVSIGNLLTVTGGAGGIALTGTANSNVGLAFGSGTYSSPGTIALVGTSSTNNGIWRFNGGVTNLTASGTGNISLNGSSTSATSSIQGVMIEGVALNMTSGATGGVSILGSGGVLAGAGTKAAISFGGTNYQSIPVAISAGTGGVTITGAGLTGTDQSFAAYGTNNTIVSAGDVNITGNKAIYYRGAITESAGTALIRADTGPVTLGTITQNGGALTVTATAGNIINADGAMSSAGAMTLTAGSGSLGTKALTAGGALNGSATTSILTEAISQTGAGVINLTAGTTLGSGAITTAGAGDITLISVGNLTAAAINKTAAAIGASTVALRSHSNVTVSAGIIAASGAGALTTVLNSRMMGGATGTISVTGDITTRGGDITGYGGTTVGGNAIGAGAFGVSLISGTLDAGGGNIAFTGATSSGLFNAINVWDSTKLLTSGAGSITLTGNSTLGTGQGVGIGNLVTLTGGAGGIALTGTANGNVGLAFGSGTYSTPGNISLVGTSATGNGIWRYNGGITNLTASGAGNVSLNGSSTSTTGSFQGIMIEGVALNMTSGATGGVSILGSGGALAGAGTKSAINFGNTSYAVPVAITGGAGGVTITGTGVAAADQSFAVFGTTSTITSAGDVNITGNKGIFYTSAITESAGTAIIRADTGFINLGAIAQNGGALTVTATAGSIVNATGAMSSAGAMTLTAGAGSLSTLGLTTPSALNGTATTTIATGVINETGAGAINLIAGGTLSTGNITIAGAGDINLTGGDDRLTLAQITKLASATGVSTLTVKSQGEITAGSNIVAQAGAGKFNTIFNSGSTGGFGGINLYQMITTQGGDIIAYGGSTPGGASIGWGSNQGVYVGGVTLNAGGGNINLNGSVVANTPVDGVLIGANASLLTSGTGSIIIKGNATAAATAGLVLQDGVTMTAGAGGIALSGDATSNVGISIGSGTYSAVGDIDVIGASVTNSGIYRGTAYTLLSYTTTPRAGSRDDYYVYETAAANPLNILTTGQGNIHISGRSTGISQSLPGIQYLSRGEFNVNSASGLTIVADGGARKQQWVQQFTSGPLNFIDIYNTDAAILIGAPYHRRDDARWYVDGGGLLIVDSYLYNGSQPVVNFTAGAGGLNLTATRQGAVSDVGSSAFYNNAQTNILSAGPINIQAAGDLAGKFAITQSGGGDTVINGNGDIRFNSIVQSGTGKINITAVDVVGSGTIRTDGDLTIEAGSMNTPTAWLQQTGAGVMKVHTVAALVSPGTVTKTNAGAASLTLASNANVTVSNAISATTGTLDVTLNSNSLSTGGTVSVTAAGTISTNGGDILIRGGSAALTAPVDPTFDYDAFVATLLATGTSFNPSGSTLNAGDGDIEIRGLSSTVHGLSILAGTSITTTGLGDIRLYGLGGTTAGSYNANGVNIGGVSTLVGTAAGKLTVMGASRAAGTTAGVNIDAATVRSLTGSVLVEGASSSVQNAGTATFGVRLTNNALVAVQGGAGTLDVWGRGGGAATFSYGLFNDGGRITSGASGATKITGYGGNGAGTTNYGVFFGLNAGSNKPIMASTAGGSLTISGFTSSGTATGIYQGAGAGLEIGSSTMTGALTLISNSMALNPASAPVWLRTTGALTIRPQSAAAMTVDSNIFAALISGNVLRSAYSSVTFGAIDGGALTFNGIQGYNSYSAPLTLASGGDIAITASGATGLVATQGLTFHAGGIVTQGIAITTPTLSGDAGTLTLSQAGNAIGALGALSVTNNMHLVDSIGLTVNGAVTTGTGLVRVTGDLTFANGSSFAATGAGTALNLTTTTKVVNNAGAAALSAANGRYLLWSQSPLTDSLGGLSYAFKQYNATYGVTAPAQASGSGVLYTLAPSLTVGLTGVFTRVYDSTIAAALAQANFNVTGLIGGDTADVVSTANYDTKNVGSGKTITATAMSAVARNGAINVYGYNLTNSSATAAIGAITPRALTASFVANDRVYNGNTLATGVFSLANVAGSDVITLDATNGALNFSDRNAGTGKTVTATGYGISGTEVANYTLNPIATGTAAISRAALLLTAVADTKVYDGLTTSAGLVLASGLIGGDTVAATQTFNTKNAGSRTLQVAGGYVVNDGNGGGNYAVTLGGAALGVIDKRVLTPVLTGTLSKVYDGTTTATLLPVNIDGVVGSDDIVVSTAVTTFDNKNTGVNKLVTVSGLSLSGADLNNYILQNTFTSANIGAITARQVAVSTSGSGVKTYDGAAGLSHGQLGTIAFLMAAGDGATAALLAADGVTLETSGATGVIVDRNAGVGKATTLNGYALANNGLGNYVLTNSTTQGLSNVARAALALTAVTDSRTYDGTMASTGVVGATGLVGGDTVTATQTFDSKNAGARALQVAGGYVVADGNGGGNYLVTVGAAASGAIAQRVVSTSVVIDDKVYDGTTAATGVFAPLANTVGGDVVEVSGTGLVFSDRHVGVGKTVTAAGLILTGADALNYALTPLANGTATITAKALTLTAVADSKTYTGTTASGAAISTSGLVAGDTVTGSQVFDSRNVGARTLQVAGGYTVNDGNGGANYAVTVGNAAVGAIAQATLTLTAVGDARTYDGTAASTGVVLINGLVGGDTATASQVFDQKNAGARTLQVAGSYAVSDGNGGGNYAVTLVGATGAIGKRTVATVLSANDKIYDATTAATGVFSPLANAINGDLVTVDNAGVMSFADKNAGTGKTVTATGYGLTGADALNYSLAGIGSDTADITKAALTLTAAADTKTYDGDRISAGLVVATGLAGTDTVAASQLFNDKNAGARLLQVAGGYVVSDGNGGGNYTVSTADAAGLINQRTVSTTLTANDKIYDATGTATGLFSALDNTVAGDTVNLDGGGVLAFVNHNAGVGRAVTATGYGLSGADSANYVLAAIAGDTADIAKAGLTLTAVADTKIYDGDAISGGLVVATGLAGADTVAATQEFAGRTAGVHALQVVGDYVVDDGAGGDNYVVTLGAETPGTILTRTLTTSVAVADKIYDGGTTATGTFGSLQNLVVGDTVVLDGAGTLAFADRNVGAGKTVSISGLGLMGADAFNYTLSSLADSTAAITAKGLTLTAVTDTKVYDGLTTSAGTVLSNGLVGGDTVAASQAFDTKNAGARALQVAGGYVVADGNGGGNYAVTLVDAAGQIDQRILTPTLGGAVTKVYDGTVTATLLAANIDGVIAGDDVIVSTASTDYADKNAGTGKLVTASGIALSGVDSGNYALMNSVATAFIGTITARQVAVTATGSGAKTYDGDDLLDHGQLGGISLTMADGDAVTQALITTDGLVLDDTAASGLLADRNAGAGKAVTLGGYALSNNALGNYVLASTTTSGVADVAAKGLTLTAVTDTKVYDGLTTSAGIVLSNGLVAGDTVTASQAFDTKNAGVRTLQIAGGYVVADGNGGGNYAVTLVDAAGQIDQRILTPTLGGAVTKVYDGTVTATLLAANIDGVIAGDDVIVSTASTDYADKNAGTGKLVTASGIALSGADSGNYDLMNSFASAFIGTITARQVAVTATGSGAKTYDGDDLLDHGQLGGISLTMADGDVATQTLIATDGLVLNDTAASGLLADRNAGAGKAVTLGGYALSNNALGNYVLASTTTNGVADVATKGLTLTAVTDTKVYDGLTTSAGTVLSNGLVAGDTVTASQAFDTKNAGARTLQVANGYVVADGNGGGNYAVTVVDAAGQIDQRVVSTVLTASGKTYDGAATATGSLSALTNIVFGETVTLTSGSLAFADKNAGIGKTVTGTGYGLTGADAANYALDTISGSATIAKAALTLIAVGDSKIYDGLRASDETVLSSGLVGGDTVAASQVFDEKDAGGRTLQVAGGYVVADGNSGGNYIVSLGSAALGAINQRTVSTMLTANDKVYDGTATATGGFSALANTIGGDDVAFDNAGTFAFADKNAGAGKVVTATGYGLSGADAANYTLATIAFDNADIAAKGLTLTAVTDTKTYDGLTASAGTVLSNGLVAGDSVAASQVFDTKNAGARTLQVAGGYVVADGNGGGNYAVTLGAAASGAIDKRIVSTSVVVADKVYDGNTIATGTFGALQNVVLNETVSLNGTGVLAFADKNVGAGKTVSISGLGLVGADASNYALSSLVSSSASITAKALSLTAVSDAKTYDGAIASTGVVALNGLVGGDTVAANQVFDSKNAGARTLQVADGYVVADGNGGGNYIISIGSAAAGQIDQRIVTTMLTANDKTYDGTATATGSLSALANSIGDDVTLDNAGAFAFADRNAGAGKVVTATGYGLSGAEAANYILAAINDDTADIAAKGLTLTAVADTMTYNGLTASAGMVVSNGLVGGDTATASQVFDSRNAGARTLQVANGYVVADGNGGGNYAVTLVDAAGQINQRVVTTILTVNDKTYDGTTAATGSFSALANTIGGDGVAFDNAGAFAFADKNAGAGKVVTATGYGLSGADAANYTLAAINDDTANIAAKGLTLTAVTDTKVYDGLTTSAGTVLSNGLVGGDTVAASQAFDTKNAGARALQVAGGYVVADGNGGGNYAVTLVDAAGQIDQRILTPTLGGAVTKVYDGTVTATLLAANIDGVIAGDDITVSTASTDYADKNAGTGKLVTASGIALSGVDSGNYALMNSVATAFIGTITARQVAVTATGSGAKTYDGDDLLDHGQLGGISLTMADGDAVTQALITTDGLVLDDTAASGLLADRNAGAGKAVTLGGYALSNNGLGNYVLASTTTSGVADVAAKGLTLTAVTDTKTYDGLTTSAGIVLSNGLVAGDTVTAGQAFDTKNAGARTVQVANGYVVADGNGGGNYAVTLVDASGQIDQRVVSTVLAANDKVYDGTTAATGGFSTLANTIGGDDVAFDNAGTFAFADKNAGAGKVVTATGYGLSGAEAANYTLATINADTADIAAKGLTLTAVTDTKTYDGLTASAGVVLASGLVGGDTVAATQTFDTKNAGARTLQVAAGSLVNDGNGGGNYAVTLVDAFGQIDQRVVSTVLTANDKTYDALRTATGSFSALGNVVSGETVTLTNGALAFADKNAGAGKVVTATGYGLSGAEAANYTLAAINDDNADIGRAGLTLWAVGDSRAYDGTVASSGVVAASGLAGTDTFVASQTFDNKNAGGRTLKVAGGYVVDDGNGGDNYLVTTEDAAGVISQRQISLKVTNAYKVEGQIDPSFVYTIQGDGFVGSDGLTGSLTRAAGETVGSYAILQGTATADANYAVTVMPATFRITSNALGGDGSPGGIADEVTGTLPTNVGAGATLPPGAHHGFDPSAGFGWGGTGALPGGTPLTVQIGVDPSGSIESGSSSGQVGNGETEGGEDQRNDQGVLDCVEGDEFSEACARAKKGWLPYPTNRVLTPTVRFVSWAIPTKPAQNQEGRQ